MICVSHFPAVLFRRTNKPDVRALMVIGLVAGPVIAAFALVVIL